MNELDLSLMPILSLSFLRTQPAMARIHLFVFSFLVSFVHYGSSSTASKYWSFNMKTINFTVHCAFVFSEGTCSYFDY